MRPALYRVVAAAVAILLATAVGCRKGPAKVKTEARVVARVGDRQITDADVYGGLYPQGRPSGARPDRAVARRVLDQLIERELVLAWAAENGVKVGDADVAARIALIEADYGARGFESYLKTQKLTVAAFRETVRENLMLEGAVEAAVVQKVSVSYDDVGAYYEAHPAEFQLPTEYHLKQIITDDKAKADEALAKVTYGSAFEDVARDASLSPERYDGGDIGYVTLDSLPPEVAAVVPTLPPGQVSPVISTPYGFEIVKVMKVRPAGQRPLAEVRTRIQDKLRTEREAQAYARWVAGLRKNTKVYVDEKVLAAL